MTVAVQLDFPGATIEQYDQINERIGLLPGGPASASGALSLGRKDRRGFPRG